MTPEESVAALTARLAIPEREPDEAFALQVERRIDIEMAERAAAAARRETLFVELAAAAALLFAGRQLLASGTDAARVVLPLLEAVSGPAMLIATLALLLVLLAADLPGRTRHG